MGRSGHINDEAVTTVLNNGRGDRVCALGDLLHGHDELRNSDP